MSNGKFLAGSMLEQHLAQYIYWRKSSHLWSRQPSNGTLEFYCLFFCFLVNGGQLDTYRSTENGYCGSQLQ